MTGFELAILLLGLAGMIYATWAVQYLGKVWTNHLQRLESRHERMMLELMRCNDRLLAIQESFQNLDKR